MIQRLDIDALRALSAIEDQGGVTRAAAHLGLSQSAVSHKIKRLESSLDCDLLSRRPGAPLFTDTGRDLLGYARRILAIHDEALRSLSKTLVQGQISLGLTEDTTCSDLSRILGRFSRLHPGVSVRTRVLQSLVLQDLLASGGIDFAIMQVFTHEVRPHDIELFRERLFWVKSPDLDLGSGNTVPFLSFDENCFYRRWAMDVAQEDGTVFATILECASAAGIVSGVRSGLGVAILNERHVTPDMDVLKGCFADPPDVTYVARRARKLRNPAIDTLIDEIKREIAGERALRIA
ncbi:LysR family transcriptional regulator [Limimaricola sp. G21655-S1]|uniref:LysR family transcriptional regulator n=1 Tax=Limimaricola sp. G21655-S1 TaxID=3014768 RepID=UPI0022AEAA8A|nr:LysR family transcriptional regulator [Limimaricola sp. G21655-S1]MCZ4262981.1 LysR family transcriptional regulator [Limimaricola sp. G21655-S1]